MAHLLLAGVFEVGESTEIRNDNWKFVRRLPRRRSTRSRCWRILLSSVALGRRRRRRKGQQNRAGTESEALRGRGGPGRAHRRAARRQAGGRHRDAEPLAPQAIAGGIAPGGHAPQRAARGPDGMREDGRSGVRLQ